MVPTIATVPNELDEEIYIPVVNFSNRGESLLILVADQTTRLVDGMDKLGDGHWNVAVPLRHGVRNAYLNRKLTKTCIHNICDFVK